MHVHRACRMPTETVVAIHPVARVIDDGARRTRTGFEGGQSHEGLVSGTGRISPPQRTVEQRLVDGFVQRLPVFLVNAVHKQIAIKRGLAHHGQHLPIAWVNGYQRASALAKQIFHHFLQTDVDRQHHVTPRHGRLAGQTAHDLAAGGDLHLLTARCAMQHRFVTLLDTQLADMGGAAVIARILAFFQCAFLFLVDAPDVADHMPRQLAIRVIAIQTRIDLHSWKFVTPGSQPCNLLIA